MKERVLTFKFDVGNRVIDRRFRKVGHVETLGYDEAAGFIYYVAFPDGSQWVNAKHLEMAD